MNSNEKTEDKKMEQTVTLTAHRGYRAKYPENTMLAFREALKLDIDSIEMDVQ